MNKVWLSALLGAALLGLLAEAARQWPQLLLLDNVQWSDEISLRALMFALRRLSHDSVGTLIALRDVDLPVVAGSVSPLYGRGHSTRHQSPS